jgi:glyoxylase-like metal-dependent hydrolase (beta-lactamase superfamily II)
MVGLRAGDTLLAGDSLFVESVARPDLEAGADGAPELAGRLYDTIHETVLTLPEATLLAPGHHGPAAEPGVDGAYAERLGTVRERLPVLGLDRSAFVDRLVSDMPPRPSNFETIIRVNLGRETADDDRAFTLELGPNNCAATADAD